MSFFVLEIFFFSMDGVRMMLPIGTFQLGGTRLEGEGRGGRRPVVNVTEFRKRRLRTTVQRDRKNSLHQER